MFRQILLRVGVRLVLVSAVCCLGGVSFWVANRVKQKATLFRQGTLRKLACSADLNSCQSEGYARVLLMIADDDPKRRETYKMERESYIKSIDAALKEYAAAFAVDPEPARRRFDAFVETRAQYRAVANRVVELVDAGRLVEARQLAVETLLPAYRRYTEAGDALLAADVATGISRAERIESACAAMQYFTVGFCLAGIVVGFLVPLALFLKVPGEPT